jgi:hypothetical protein
MLPVPDEQLHIFRNILFKINFNIVFTYIRQESFSWYDNSVRVERSGDRTLGRRDYRDPFRPNL